MTTRDLAYYLAKVPPEHAGDSNFMRELALVLAPIVAQQAFLATIPAAFDLDLAIGVQLDAVGAWAGTSRHIPIPIDNPWFTFGSLVRGFGAGYWFEGFSPRGISDLDDETFRRLIRAVILCNGTDGTRDSLQAALDAYFVDPAEHVFVIDGTDYGSSTLWFSFGDATRGFGLGTWFPEGSPASSTVDVALVMQVGIGGKIPTVVDLAILEQRLIPFAPAAVQVEWGITTVNGAPVFGFGVDNEFIGGFGEGAWGRDPEWVAEHILVS